MPGLLPGLMKRDVPCPVARLQQSVHAVQASWSIQHSIGVKQKPVTRLHAQHCWGSHARTAQFRSAPKVLPTALVEKARTHVPKLLQWQVKMADPTASVPPLPVLAPQLVLLFLAYFPDTASPPNSSLATLHKRSLLKHPMLLLMSAATPGTACSCCAVAQSLSAGTATPHNHQHQSSICPTQQQEPLESSLHAWLGAQAVALLQARMSAQAAAWLHALIGHSGSGSLACNQRGPLRQWHSCTHQWGRAGSWHCCMHPMGAAQAAGTVACSEWARRQWHQSSGQSKRSGRAARTLVLVERAGLGLEALALADVQQDGVGLRARAQRVLRSSSGPSLSRRQGMCLQLTAMGFVLHPRLHACRF
jgi:hypothetical protein